jgi:cholesterol transport system auxiliary component
VMIRVAAATALLSLAGCVAAHAPPRQFDLGDFDALENRPHILATNVIVVDVSQPSWMRTRDMFYRLDYASPPRPQRYAINQWVASPAELVTLRIRQTVQAANSGFTLQTFSASGDYLLESSLDEFTQGFTTRVDSHCVVQLRASLRTTAGQLVGQRVLRVETPAPSADASGAALCLASAVDRLSNELVQWLSTVTAKAP